MYPRKIDIGHHVRRVARTGFFSRRPPGRRPDRKKILSTIGIAAGALVLGGTIALIALIAWVANDLPDPNNISLRNVAQTTKIYDRKGETVLYAVHGEQKRTVVELENIADVAKKATIAAEDRDFYTHKGYDLRGIARGFYRNIFRSGGKLQSGSTITQQFIKKSVLSDEQTYIRKAKEIILSIEMERRFSKDQILKLYLNEIPYGGVSYGIESASQTFFAKSAKDLTLSEAAVLAALPKGPTYYSPYGNHRDALIVRQQYIIDAMVEEGYVTKEEADEAKKDDVLARVQPNREPIIAPHFVFYVKEMLAEEFGEQAVERGGLKIITTLDIDKQKAAEEAITGNVDEIKKWNGNTAAMAAIDPRRGEVLAMVGSADYFDEEINGNFNSILGSIQPGSSIKPIVYAAAFEKGFTPSTVVEDVKTNFSSGKPYEPSNYDGKERGPVTLKEALAGSLNIPAVKVLYLVGFEAFKDFAQRVGYTTLNDDSRYGLSLVLGGANVRPIEHIAAFGAFAQDGVIRPTKAILKVEDSKGEVLLDATKDAPGKRVFDKEVARQINDILSDNAARAYVFGEQNYLTLSGRPVAAKTGTTNGYKDAWAVGYTPSLVAGVWVGHSRGTLMKQGADGSKVAAPIWNEFMRKALAGTAAEPFTAPEPVQTGKPILDGEKNAQVMLKIDRISGKLATEHTPQEFVEEKGFGIPHSILFFVDKEDPRGPIPEHPENDPQFANWEKSVAEWVEKQGIVITDAVPPTEYDDVHTPENKPAISLLWPYEGGAITDRNFTPSVSVSARRGIAKVEYLMDSDIIGTAVFQPFATQVTIPNRFSKGFHTLTAKVYDDVGNSSSTSVTVNLTADPGPLGISWSSPWNSQTIYQSQFPFMVKFSISDVKSVREFHVTAKSQDDATEQVIGDIRNPSLSTMTVPWGAPPAPGKYHVTVEAILTSGDRRSESVPVTVQ
jgi:1A family penicillin-binding protein